jgi:HEAT repeat protein
MENDIDSLIADFTCDDVIKCQTARRKLVNMGSAAVEPLVRGLSNKRHWVRWEAAKALGQIGDKAAAEALVKALEDDEFDVRWLAAEALITIGRDALEPLLTALADYGDESPLLRQGAHHVLHDMDRRGLGKILKPVMASVEDVAPSVEVLQVAKRALDALRTR